MGQIEGNNRFAEADKQWRDLIISIGKKELAVFESNNIAYTEDIIVCNCRRKLMIWIYCLLVNYKKLKPIEDLDIPTKNEMWGFIKEIWGDRPHDKKRMIEVSKVFYTIEYFINETNSQC